MTYIKGVSRFRNRASKRRLLLDFADEFPWGEHRNRTVRYVMENNPSYLRWVVETPPFANQQTVWVFTPAVLEELKVRMASPGYVEISPFYYYSKVWPRKKSNAL